MPNPREVLEKLSLPDLKGLAESAGLAVADRRKGSSVVEALEALDPAHLRVLLVSLPRAALKDACRALGLDGSGRKAILVDRLIPLDCAAKRSVPAAPPAAGKLTQADLERHLWSAADILRGSIDSSDYKNFIFGLLFLKRLSDRFDEECAAIRAEGGNPDDPDEHEFFVPRRSRWPEIQKHATNLGEVLNKAASGIEENNGAALEGVLGGIDFNDERKLGDARQRDQLLARLIQQFAGLDLRNASLSEPDMLGRAYEYLIERFADDAVKKGGAMASSSVGGLSNAFIPVSEDAGMIRAVRAGALSLAKLEAMTAVCSVGLDMVAVPGETSESTLAGIIADEMAIGVVNHKTTAVRIIPVPGKKAGETVEWGGLLGTAIVQDPGRFGCAVFHKRSGRIPAPVVSYRN